MTVYQMNHKHMMMLQIVVSMPAGAPLYRRRLLLCRQHVYESASEIAAWLTPLSRPYASAGGSYLRHLSS